MTSVALNVPSTLLLTALIEPPVIGLMVSVKHDVKLRNAAVYENRAMIFPERS